MSATRALDPGCPGYTLKQLRALAKERGLTGYSRQHKAVLCGRLRTLPAPAPSLPPSVAAVPAQPSPTPQITIADAPDFWRRFELGERLGAGTFGHTFLVRERATGERFALKVLSSRATEQDLAREAGVVARLSTAPDCRPHLLCYRGAFVVPAAGLPESVRRSDLGARYALLTDYVPGPTLDRLAENNAALGLAGLPMAIQLLDAISTVHSLGFAHGDVALRNALLAPDGRVVLIDFGEACPLEASGWPASRNCSDRAEFLAHIMQQTGRPPPSAEDVTRYLLSQDTFNAMQAIGELLTGQGELEWEEGLGRCGEALSDGWTEDSTDLPSVEWLREQLLYCFSRDPPPCLPPRRPTKGG